MGVLRASPTDFAELSESRSEIALWFWLRGDFPINERGAISPEAHHSRLIMTFRRLAGASDQCTQLERQFCFSVQAL